MFGFPPAPARSRRRSSVSESPVGDPVGEMEPGGRPEWVQSVDDRPESGLGELLTRASGSPTVHKDRRRRADGTAEPVPAARPAPGRAHCTLHVEHDLGCVFCTSADRDLRRAMGCRLDLAGNCTVADHYELRA